MITNSEEITKYTNYNKIYIPSNYFNSNYKYILDNNYITIITNNNCYTQINSTYCDCIRYNQEYNILTNTYSCNTNTNSNNTINISYITDDINYSNRIVKKYTFDYIILFGILIIALIFVQTMKKNSRRI